MNITKVRMLRSSQGMTLVEWRDDRKGVLRSWITGSMIMASNGNEATVNGPERGIPEGDDLVLGLQPNVKPSDILRELHNSGIWTYADVMANPNVVRAAIVSAYGIDLGAILLIAREQSKLGKQ